jgi:hypothetical protein
MRRVLLAVLLTTVFIPTASASDLTVEGDGLELVTEYKITDDGYETVYRDEESFKEDILNDDLTPFVLRDKLFGSDVLVYFDDALDIVAVINGRGEQREFFPLGNNGLYIENGSFFFNMETAGFKEKKVYNLEGDLLATVPSRGAWVKTFPSGEMFVISRSDWISGALDAYDVQGNHLYEMNFDENYPIGEAFGHFNKDKDWLLVADRWFLDREKHPDVRRGTRVFDEKGNLQFTLNPDVFCLHSGANVRGNVLYGSDTYIIQIASLADLTSTEGSSSERYVTNEYDQDILEVYDGKGQLLWDYLIPGRSSDTHFFLSENEEFIVLFVRSKKDIVVFETDSGRELHRASNILGKGWIYDGYISNDGSTVAVSIFSDDPVDDLYTISIFDNNRKIGSIISTPEYGRLNGFTTHDGEYLVAGIPSTVCVYKIK